MIRVWLEDSKPGIACGINHHGDLFLGDTRSGYNLPNTKENRIKITKDFCRITGRPMPELLPDGSPKITETD